MPLDESYQSSDAKSAVFCRQGEIFFVDQKAPPGETWLLLHKDCLKTPVLKRSFFELGTAAFETNESGSSSKTADSAAARLYTKIHKVFSHMHLHNVNFVV